MNSQPQPAKLSVWAKGFRVSDRSEEFQLVIPPKADELDQVESEFLEADWAPILPRLYRLTDEERRAQFCVRVLIDHIMVIMVEGSRDRHQRRSVVAAVCSIPIDWQVDDLGSLLRAGSRLARKYADEFANEFALAPDAVHSQLRQGIFLPVRTFNLADFDVPTATHWDMIAKEIRRWNGIRGIGTTPLLQLGANIRYGASDEDVGATSVSIDGEIAIDTTEIRPLSPRIQLWPAPKQSVVTTSTKAPEPHRPEDVLEATLHGIQMEQRALSEKMDTVLESQRATHGTVLKFISDLTELFFSRKRKK